MADYCINCGDENHRIDTCDEPNQVHGCPRCLFSSLDGSGHSSPCFPLFTRSGFRKDVHSVKPKAILKILLNEPDTALYVLDKEKGQFVQPGDGATIVSAATEGLFEFDVKKGENTKFLITFMGASVKRFNIMFAVLNDGLWRLRHRCVLSPYEGLIGFKMHKTMYKNGNDRYTIFEEFKINSALVIGVKTAADSLNYRFQVNANESGIVNDTRFNGYEGNIVWNKRSDSVVISENLRPENAIRRLFHKDLYPRNGEHHDATSRQTQTVENEMLQQVNVSVSSINL